MSFCRFWSYQETTVAVGPVAAARPNGWVSSWPCHRQVLWLSRDAVGWNGGWNNGRKGSWDAEMAIEGDGHTENGERDLGEKTILEFGSSFVVVVVVAGGGDGVAGDGDGDGDGGGGGGGGSSILLVFFDVSLNQLFL